MDLELIDDPLNGPVAQHDARITPDGQVSIFDNRSGREGEPARAVAYEVDEDAGTARMVSSMSEPGGANSRSMGSCDRTQPTAPSWWAGVAPPTLFTEFDRDGAVLMDVKSRPDLYTYQVQKVHRRSLTPTSCANARASSDWRAFPGCPGWRPLVA